MTGTAASPIKLDTGDVISVSNQPENAACSGQNRKMTRPCNATKSVAWKRKQLRSGKPPSAGLTFIVDKPNGECRLRIALHHKQAKNTMRAKLTQIRLHRLCMEIQGVPETIYWEINDQNEVFLDEKNLNNFLALAAFPFAMEYSLDLEIPGSVDYMLAANLGEFSAAWCQYRPDLFKKPIKIIAEEYTTCSEENPRTIEYSAAYSGGFDSTFLLSRIQQSQSNPFPPIGLAIMIDGFGFDLDDPERFSSTYITGKKFCDSLDIRLTSVRTNWAKIIKWYETFHIIGIVSILTLMSKNVSGAYIGLDVTYEEEFDLGPWGNLAVLDRMLSASNYPVFPYGGRHSRIEKMVALSNLKKDSFITVCNNSKRISNNCGTCEKCQRTQLGYRSQNITIPDGMFDKPLAIERVKKIKLTKRIQEIFYKQIRREWKDKSDPFLFAVENLLAQRISVSSKSTT